MFAELQFPLPVRKGFTYSVPKELRPYVKIGIRAIAPFGKRTLSGFITKISDSATIKEKIKDIYDLLDESPIFSTEDLMFYEWLADYYLCSLGEALKLCVPYGTDVHSKRKISSDSSFCKTLLEEEKKKNTLRFKLLQIFSENDLVTFSYLQKNVGKKNLYATLSSLEKQGAITIHNEVERAQVKEKKASYIKFSKSLEDIYEEIPLLEKKSPKQLEALLALLKNKKKEIMLSTFMSENKINLASIDGLIKKGIITKFQKQVFRKYNDNYKEEETSFELTTAQQKIINDISIQVNENKFAVNLLHGVTGSGKTQVYIELVKRVLTQKKTALILVPEISLTPQITSRLLNNFGDNVSVIHSRMSSGERFDSWQNVLRGKCSVVVGARSALFAPLKNIGLIIVDEEHDSSYKQDDIPKYNGRDSAIIRGKICGCPVILGSATPSIESMYNALNGKYILHTLTDRVDDAKLPKITLVNIVEEKKNKKMENIFSVSLLEKIDERLKRKEGIILLQNRRGFATQIYCIDCGQIESCENCSVSMVYHINKNYLHCHYCGLTKEVPVVCSYCGSRHLKYFGTGTERVEDELQSHFPEVIIERIDSDSISKKGKLGDILQRFRKGEINILVGTQMVAKGLDFSHVTLVGVISAETSLWFPDFRADERTFQLLTQVAGRAGRSKVEGEVVIQTQNDKHFVLQKVLNNDYDGFFKKEIIDREKMAYPPFSRICLIEIKDKDEEKAKQSITHLYNEIKLYKKFITVSPPSTAIIARLKGEFRYQLLIKSLRTNDPGGSVLRKILLESLLKFYHKTKYKDIKLSVDIDPQSII